MSRRVDVDLLSGDVNSLLRVAKYLNESPLVQADKAFAEKAKAVMVAAEALDAHVTKRMGFNS